jgi:hypothetical protein
MLEDDVAGVSPVEAGTNELLQRFNLTSAFRPGALTTTGHNGVEVHEPTCSG